MKNAKVNVPAPRQLKSGSWFIQLRIDGQSIPITESDEKACIAKAAAIKAGLIKQKKKPVDMTVGEAIDRYIESKDAVLSPSTVAGYRRIRANALQDLMSVKLSDLTQERVQRSINKMSREKSPKTVKNAHGLLTATLAEYLPDLILRTTLPQKQRVDIIVPSDSDVDAILAAVRGKSIELPVLLAMWLGLRMSEIRGLTWECIEDDTLHIKQARVDEGLKGTKTYNSNRYLPIPPYIKKLLNEKPHTEEFIIPDSRRAIYSRFDYYVKKAGIQHYRFHDLRHVNASVMLQLGVPDKYAMERMGHATNNMLKTVYQHTMPEEQRKVASSIDGYFEKMLISVLTKK